MIEVRFLSKANTCYSALGRYDLGPEQFMSLGRLVSIVRLCLVEAGLLAMNITVASLSNSFSVRPGSRA